nr:ATP-binding protein [Lentimicrobium sp. S6]
MQHGYLLDAITNFKLSLPIYWEEEDSLNILDTYRGLSYVYSYGKNQKQSLIYNLKSLDIALPLKDSVSLSTIYNNLGAIYMHLRNYEASVSNFQKSIDIMPENAPITDVIPTYSNIAVVQVEHKRFEEANKNFNYVKSHLHKFLSSYMKAYLFTSISTYYTETEKFDSAFMYLDSAKQIIDTNHYIQIESRYYRRLGELYLKQNKYKKSLAYFDKCIALSKSIEMNEEFSAIYRKKSEAYSKIGDHTKAFESLQLANQSLDSLNHNNIANLLSEYEIEQQIKDELKRKRLEKELLEQKLENENIRAKSKLRMAIGGIILLILIFVIGIFYFLRVRKNNALLKSQHKLIEEQKSQLEENIEKLELNEQNLKVLNATKDKFFSIIAHDLKSPFTAIIGFTDELKNNYKEYSDPERMNMLHIIANNSQLTFKLLENLLAWANSQSGHLNLNKRKLELEPLVKESISAYLGAAALKEIDVETSIEEADIWGDKETIKIIISNLFNNATKYCHQKGEINIYSKLKKGHIEIHFKDSGIGMSQDIMDGLFKMEKNVQRMGTSDEKGTGLGLILCQEFIHKNNGDIGVKSTEGEGSEFCISLPLYMS